jgi:hypothetical protein
MRERPKANDCCCSIAGLRQRHDPAAVDAALAAGIHTAARRALDALALALLDEPPQELKHRRQLDPAVAAAARDLLRTDDPAAFGLQPGDLPIKILSRVLTRA